MKKHFINSLVFGALLALSCLTAFAKGGGKLMINVNSGYGFPVEGCQFTIYPYGSEKPVCTMTTDANGVATSKKLEDGHYTVVNSQMTMGYNKLGSADFEIEDSSVVGFDLWAKQGSYSNEAYGPDEGTVKVSISGTLSKEVMQAVEAFPHVAIADHFIDGYYLTYAYPMVCSKNAKSSSASKAFKQNGLKAKLALSGQLSFSLTPTDCIDCFAFGYYVDNALETYRPEDFKASCTGKLKISDQDRVACLVTNGQFWLETFWGSQNFLFGGQSIELNDKWKGSGSAVIDGIESTVSVSINKKTGKFKMAISSKNAVGVSVRYGE